MNRNNLPVTACKAFGAHMIAWWVTEDIAEADIISLQDYSVLTTDPLQFILPICHVMLWNIASTDVCMCVE